MTIRLAALFLAALPVAAQAADWRLAAEVPGRDAGRALGFIDAETLHQSEGRTIFWAFLVHDPRRAGYDNAIFQFSGDCATRIFEQARVFTYRGGTLIDATGRGITGRPVPGTLEAGLVDTACRGRPLSAARIRDPYDFAQRAWRAPRSR